MRRLNRKSFQEESHSEMLMIRTWCRICGKPTVVALPKSYGEAVNTAYWIDDQVTDHEGHIEHGGWGVHWRLDDVLRSVFPSLHRFEDLFPTPPWYRHAAPPGIDLKPLRIVTRNGVDRIL